MDICSIVENPHLPAKSANVPQKAPEVGKYKIVTMTVTTNLQTDSPLGLSQNGPNSARKIYVDLESIYHYIELDTTTKGIESVKSIFGYRRKQPLAPNSPKALQKTPQTRFFNQNTFVINTENSAVNLKLFKNGNIQMTGVKSLKDAETAVELLIQKIKAIRGHKYQSLKKDHNNVWVSESSRVYSIDIEDGENIAKYTGYYEIEHKGRDHSGVANSKLFIWDSERNANIQVESAAEGKYLIEKEFSSPHQKNIYGSIHYVKIADFRKSIYLLSGKQVGYINVNMIETAIKDIPPGTMYKVQNNTFQVLFPRSAGINKQKWFIDFKEKVVFNKRREIVGHLSIALTPMSLVNPEAIFGHKYPHSKLFSPPEKPVLRTNHYVPRILPSDISNERIVKIRYSGIFSVVAGQSQIVHEPFEHRMINALFHAGYEINQTKLNTLLIETYLMQSNYDAEAYPGINIKYFFNNTGGAQSSGICSCNLLKCKHCLHSNEPNCQIQDCSLCREQYLYGDNKIPCFCVACKCIRITLLLFGSGEVIITGAKSAEQIHTVYLWIASVLKQHHTFLCL